jgi:hypothetical protein
VPLIRDQEAGGSNLLAPTKSLKNLQVVASQTAYQPPTQLQGCDRILSSP